MQVNIVLELNDLVIPSTRPESGNLGTGLVVSYSESLGDFDEAVGYARGYFRWVALPKTFIVMRM